MEIMSGFGGKRNENEILISDYQLVNPGTNNTEGCIFYCDLNISVII